MPDNSNQRYRGGDPYGRAPDHAQPTDPLAELARLIGNNDGYANAPQGAARADPRYPDYPEPRAAEWAPVPPQRQQAQPGHDPYAAQPDPYADSYSAAQGYDPRYPGYAPHDQFGADLRAAQGHDSGPHGYPDYGSPQQPYANGGYAGQSADPHGYQPDSRTQFSDEMYEDVRRPRRRGMVLALAILGFAVVGTAGAFGYRAVFSNSPSSKNAPVIRADAAPNKIVPAQADGQSGKLIQDRLGDRNTAERVVVREEQPVDIRDSGRAQPRVVFPGPAATGQSAGLPGSATALAAVPPASGTSPLAGEPKRVRTVTIRPDQPVTAPMVQPSRASNPSVPDSAAASAPRNAATSSTARNAQPFPTPIGTPGASEGGPLPLNPAGSARSSGAQRVASAPASGGTDGVGYTVQVSSQRSEADAQSSFRSLQSKFPDVLANRQAIIKRADLGEKGVYYRAQIGPFGTADEATELCGNLKSAGGQCVVQRN